MPSTFSKSTAPEIVLGLDYGEKRVGTALLVHGLPQPLGVVAYSPTVFQDIDVLCQEQNVSLIVVGISEGQTEVKTRQFISTLLQHLTLPITTWDETLSSQEAQAKYHHLLAKFPLDALAASVMLEDWYACLPS